MIFATTYSVIIDSGITQANLVHKATASHDDIPSTELLEEQLTAVKRLFC